MKSYEEATKCPHCYPMLDLKPTTNDKHRLNSNVLPEENIAGQQNMDHYARKPSYEQSPILNAVYNSDQQMKKIVQHCFWHQMKRVPFTLMNYTVSNHSKINSKINFVLKIIFKLNFFKSS